MSDYPSSYRFTRDHEWIAVEGAKGKIGITSYAQSELGDVVYVELPKVGDAVTAGASFGTVESVKAVSEIFSPVTGTVTEINAHLNNAPETLNQDPHGEGWLIKVSLNDPAEVEKLLSAEDYQTFISSQQH